MFSLLCFRRSTSKHRSKSRSNVTSWTNDTICGALNFCCVQTIQIALINFINIMFDKIQQLYKAKLFDVV